MDLGYLFVLEGRSNRAEAHELTNSIERKLIQIEVVRSLAVGTHGFRLLAHSALDLLFESRIDLDGALERREIDDVGNTIDESNQCDATAGLLSRLAPAKLGEGRLTGSGRSEGRSAKLRHWRRSRGGERWRAQ